MKRRGIILLISIFVIIIISLSMCSVYLIINKNDDNNFVRSPYMPVDSNDVIREGNGDILENDRVKISWWSVYYKEDIMSNWRVFITFQIKNDNIGIEVDDVIKEDYHLHFDSYSINPYGNSFRGNLSDWELYDDGKYYLDLVSVGDQGSVIEEEYHVTFWGSTSANDWKEDDLITKVEFDVPTKYAMERIGYVCYNGETTI